LTGRFIYHNYRQALDRISTDGPRLKELFAELKIGPQQLQQYLESEREYLEKRLYKEDDISISAEYITLLEKLQDAK
jgi:iron-sulfur cluster repair protein YtfE (RIC family)